MSRSKGRDRKASRGILTPAAGYRVAAKIQRALSFDLLKPPYSELTMKDLECATRGHCYVATEAAHHLFGRSASFAPTTETMVWDAELTGGSSMKTDEILDPTAPQLQGETAIYKKGRRQNFQQPTPSARARELMRRVRKASAR